MHSFKLSEDRSSIDLYVYDSDSQLSGYTKSTSWCDFTIICKRKVTEQTVETIWSTQFRNIHFDFKKPDIDVTHAPTQFTTGLKDYSVNLNLTGDIITAAGDVKAEIVYYKTGELLGNSFDTAKTLITETFSTAGATKFTINFSFTKEIVEARRFPPKIGVKLSYTDSDGDETYCIYNINIMFN